MRWTGLILCLLVLVGICRLFVPSESDATAAASEAPLVVTIEEDAGPAQIALEPAPVVESAGPTLEQRVYALEAQVAKLEKTDGETLEIVRGSAENATQTIGLIRDLQEAIDKLKNVDDAIVRRVKELQERIKPQLNAAPPEQAEPPKPVPAPEPAKPPTAAANAPPPKSAVTFPPSPYHLAEGQPEPERRIVVDTMDPKTGMRCAPCEKLAAETLPQAAAEGWAIEIVERDDREVPHSTVYYGHLFVRQRGFMSLARLREIEAALKGEWARLRR